jgi:signal transduction histidine kinase
VRSFQDRLTSPSGALRRQVERLDGLPLRPASARWGLRTLSDPSESDSERIEAVKSPPVTDVDPGWVLSRWALLRRFDPLELLADRPWWPNLGNACGEALTRHWRHSVSVGLAARRLARDAGDSDPERVARAGLLHGLGRWAVAAVDAAWLTDWLAESDPARRLESERRSLASDLSGLGRLLAERWGCDPLVVDAAWLHADRDGALNGCASDPKRLALIQEAYALAERTPWALSSTALRDPPAGEARLKLLIAEVQVRCGSPFVEPDATSHEERLARSNARLRGELERVQAALRSRDRFLDAVIAAEPGESPEAWAERAGLAWCGEPGITAARVVWTGDAAATPPQVGATPAPGSADAEGQVPGPGRGPGDAGPTRDPRAASPDVERPASVIWPLGAPGRPAAEIHLWTAPPGPASWPDLGRARAAWQAWAVLVAERARLAGHLDAVIRGHRERVAGEETRLRQSKLEALAEFAAGAGHELNNPLAVIVGRAQLLLVRETDPASIRSLRAILTQAQRAHRILRDLMYFVRPPEPRPRHCQPEEIVRNCFRDLRENAEERGVRLAAEARGTETKVWADPDALRHLTEILVRNALEATPSGGTIQVTTTASVESLSWTVQDSGRGMTTAEGVHLFDPFYCGRQAGRGLGLGLPRAARIVAQAGGEIRWHAPAGQGQGTTFHVRLPLSRPPQAPAELAASSASSLLAAPASAVPKDDQTLPRT